MWACVISSVVMGIAAAIVNYFILLPLFETFMPLDQLIASFGEFLPFIKTKLDVVLFNALPFNILKGLVIGAIAMMIYKKLTPILKGETLKCFCVNAKIADELEKMEAIDKFLSFALSVEGAQIYTDNDKSPSCVTGVKAEVPQFQPFFDYVEANGFEADGAYPPTGFEDTKRGKIQNVLLDKNVDAFLTEMTNDWNQAVEDSK